MQYGKAYEMSVNDDAHSQEKRTCGFQNSYGQIIYESALHPDA